MTDSTEPKFSPDAEHRYFLAEPQEPLKYFATAADRGEHAKRQIENYRDLGCGFFRPDTGDIVAGVITHKATQYSVTYPVGDVEEDECDQNGRGPFEGEDPYLWDYELQPTPVPPPFLPMTNAEKPMADFGLTGYSVEAIEGSLAIWGHFSSCIRPLVFLRRPKWIKDDACWDDIVKFIMMSLRPNTAVR